MSRKKRETDGGSSPEWLTTYSDLVTLLLTFFVMLYGMSVLDANKFDQAASSLRGSFLKLSDENYLLTQSGDSYLPLYNETDFGPVSDELSEEAKLENAKADIQQSINELGLGDSVRIVEEEGKIILRFNSVLLFDLGSADIKPSGYEALDKIGQVLKNLDNEILVQGHTDDLPINTYLFPSNWELSTKRATNVVLYLVNNVGLDPAKLTATGNGEYRPIAPNDSEENRQQNRRIDIVIVK